MWVESRTTKNDPGSYDFDYITKQVPLGSHPVSRNRMLSYILDLGQLQVFKLLLKEFITDSSRLYNMC